MRKRKLLLLLLLLGFVIGCEKEKTDQEMPGNIPGMGNAEGDFVIKEPFTLPEGVALVGEIRGIGDASIAREYDRPIVKLKADEPDVLTIGCGGEWVALDLLLENSDGANKTVTIPAGCIFECQEEGYQHGITLQDVRIHLLGNSQLQIKLYLFCVNKGRNGSDAVVTYVIRGVSASEWIAKLTDALKYKDIDVSGFTEEEMDEYNRIAKGLQDIVWAITNGSGVTEDDWGFINDLRDVINSNE